MRVDLRGYQAAAFDQAREHIRAGARSILINAPTGSGKTVLASALMEMAQSKGNRVNFVVDRLSLVAQTSETFDRYGLEHGVIQSQHPRYRPSLLGQVCSIQTISRRGWPESSLDIFDEAHVLHAAHKARLQQKQTIVIGLTATPFTRGLGAWFEAVVNVTTTRKLITDGWLAPYRIYSCAEPDMNGVAVKSTGEWDEKEASGRALQVVGDVVKEYQTHGENRKFICSAVDTAHVDELARQFLAAGINVATYTYKDSEDDRTEVTAEFRRAESAIRGLITVTAASRGFDVPDVSCVIMARPLRKSLAEHIQLFGRGLRIAPGKTDCLVLDHCIATGQRVLTDRGLVPIERITLAHRLWDGHEYVSHGGVVSRGRKGLIRYAGLTATPDHPVKTAAGWRTLGHCAYQQTPVVATGVGRTALWERDGHFTRGDLAGGARAALHACALRVRHLRLSLGHLAEQLARRAHEGLQRLQSTASLPQVALCAGAEHAAPLHQAERSSLEGLRRERDRVPFRLSDHLRTLGARQPGHSRERSGSASGSRGQQRPLRAGQSEVGVFCAERLEHEARALGSVDASVPARAPRGALRGRITAWLSLAGAVVRRDHRALGAAVEEAEGEVWDVLDCGPRNSFTCEGLLVHNSGNAARFFADCEDFFDNGIDELDDGKTKPKKKAEKKEIEPVKCPSCRAIHKPAPFCPVCGHEYPKRQTVQHVPGTLKELISGGHHRELTRDIWPQVCAYVLERREGDAARRQALAIYRDMVGDWPRAKWENTTPVECSMEVRNRIRHQQIRFAKGRERSAAMA